ncbi:MAG TPA: surface-adhesin E family protein [Caulobacteraceae bacterium]
MNNKSNRFAPLAVVLAAGALLFPAQALSTEYYVLSGDAEDLTLIDKDSMTRDGSVVRAWLLTIYREPQMIEDTPIVFMEALMDVDCAGHRARSLSFKGRGDDGELAQTVDDDHPEWDPTDPESVGAMWEAAICEENPFSGEAVGATDLLVLRAALLQMGDD